MMKKLLAVLMAVLMLGSALVVAVSAKPYNGYEIGEDEILLVLNFNGGTPIGAVDYFDMTTTPGSPFDASSDKLDGSTIVVRVKQGETYLMPHVKAGTEGYQCDGWINRYDDDDAIIPGGKFKATVQDHADDFGNYVEYVATFSPTEVKEDTLTKIKGILIKVFGILLGLFYGDMDLGQSMVADLFGSLFG